MKKVLVVDDQAMLRELIAVVLRGEGLGILEAASGEEAVAIARSEKPDLILLDIMMPGGMDGLEVARLLKRAPETCNCPIVAVTAKVQKADRVKALEAGIDEYLAKPFTLTDLREKVRLFLG
jgi:CheY-like chemotaxis protein